MDVNLRQTKHIKKLKDAHDDIEKIYDTVRTNYAVQKHGSSLYQKLILNQDYGKYIVTLKSLRNMGGSIPFERLDENHKREVLLMVRDAIELYLGELYASITAE